MHVLELLPVRLYQRTATPDWSPETYSEKVSKKKSKQINDYSITIMWSIRHTTYINNAISCVVVIPLESVCSLSFSTIPPRSFTRCSHPLHSFKFPFLLWPCPLSPPHRSQETHAYSPSQSQARSIAQDSVPSQTQTGLVPQLYDLRLWVDTLNGMATFRWWTRASPTPQLSALVVLPLTVNSWLR